MSFFGDFLDSPWAKALLAGGAIAATGGAAAPALLAGEGAAAAGAGGLLGAGAAGASAAPAAAGLLADPMAAYLATGGAEGSILGAGLTGAGGASGAVGAGTAANAFGNIKQAADFVKPIGDAASSASKVKGLFDGPDSAGPPPPQIMPGQGGAQTLASISNSLEQQNITRQNEELQRRLQRRQTMMGGR